MRGPCPASVAYKKHIFPDLFVSDAGHTVCYRRVYMRVGLPNVERNAKDHFLRCDILASITFCTRTGTCTHTHTQKHTHTQMCIVSKLCVHIWQNEKVTQKTMQIYKRRLSRIGLFSGENYIFDSRAKMKRRCIFRKFNFMSFLQTSKNGSSVVKKRPRR